MKRIRFTNDQSGNFMRLSCNRHPLRNFISFMIQNLNRCTAQFSTGSDVCFLHLDTDAFIPDVTGQFCMLHIICQSNYTIFSCTSQFSQNTGPVQILQFRIPRHTDWPVRIMRCFNSKSDGFCKQVSVWRFCFCQDVVAIVQALEAEGLLLFHCQSGNLFELIASQLLLELKLGTFQRRRAVFIDFVDIQLISERYNGIQFGLIRAVLGFPLLIQAAIVAVLEVGAVDISFRAKLCLIIQFGREDNLNFCSVQFSILNLCCIMVRSSFIGFFFKRDLQFK